MAPGHTSEWRQGTGNLSTSHQEGGGIVRTGLPGRHQWRVKRALFALFKGAVSKDVVSRTLRKVKEDWDPWCSRSLAEEDIVHPLLEGIMVKTRLHKKAIIISVLMAVGVRGDGQKVLLAIQHMAGESTAAWRQFLEHRWCAVP